MKEARARNWDMACCSSSYSSSRSSSNCSYNISSSSSNCSSSISI